MQADACARERVIAERRGQYVSGEITDVDDRVRATLSPGPAKLSRKAPGGFLRQPLASRRRAGEPQRFLGHLASRWRAAFASVLRNETVQEAGKAVATARQGAEARISSLFRKEAIKAKHDSWLGNVQLVEPLPVRLVAIVSAVLIAAALAYAVLGTYTRRVHATGSVQPTTGLITVGAPAAGLIASMAVSEGQSVEKGQILYVLNLDATSASGPTQARVIALLYNETRVLQRSRDLRLSLAKVEKQALADQLDNLSRQHARVREQITQEEATLPDVKAFAARLRDAASRRIVTDTQYQNQVYVYAELLGQYAQFQQTAIALEGKISDTTSSLAGFDDKVAKDVNDIDQRLAQTARQIAESEARRSIEIRAPEAGVLTAVRGHVGQQVTSGLPMVTLLPRGGALEAHLYVDSSSIGFIREGAPVLLRYAAFPFQRFGLSQATVIEVTRAPIGANEAQAPSAAPAPPTAPASPSGPNAAGQFYRIIVRPQRAYVVADGERKPLEAGMQVDADIALDTRRLYEWMLDPLYHLRRSAGVVSGEGLK
jgi:membrane fusion protein